MAIAAEAVRSTMTERRDFRNRENRLQADWLAEAAVERAAARLAADAGYHGETWSLPASAIGGSADGQVVIQIDELKESPGRFAANVQADYPAEGEYRARTSKRIVIERPQTGEKP